MRCLDVLGGNPWVAFEIHLSLGGLLLMGVFSLHKYLKKELVNAVLKGLSVNIESKARASDLV